MGLDMYLYSLNKKLHQDDMEKYSIFTNREYDMQLNTDFIEAYDSCENVKDFAARRFEWKLKEYEKWDLEGRNNKSFDTYITNIISSSTPKFNDFKTKEDLLSHYAGELENAYGKIKEEMDYFKSDEWLGLKSKFEGTEETEEAYWRKHSDLNGYFTDIAEQREVSDEMFNGQCLVLEQEDIKTLVDLVNKHLSGDRTFEVTTGFFWGSSTNSDWENTTDVFEKLLEDFDFDNKTLIYRCSW